VAYLLAGLVLLIGGIVHWWWLAAWPAAA